MACLDSIAESVTGIAYEVIIVLNDPTPDLAAEIEEGVIGARVFSFRANLGFGGAVNFAAERARGEYLVLLNDDCVATRGWLEPLVDTEERRPRCAIVGGTNLNPDGTVQEAGSVIWSDGSASCIGEGMAPHRMRFERRVDYVSGGCFLIKKAVWDQLGGFDESYYPAYYEDVDLCLRAAEAGWEAWYQPLSVVFHARSASTGAHFRHYLFQRAQETFVNRWASLLETREPVGARERAIWKAMGCPIRVLVVDEQPPGSSLETGAGRVLEMLSVIEREPDLHVTFFAGTPDGQVPPHWPLRSVRVVDDLEEHLARDGVDFDVVVVSRRRDGGRFRDLLARYVPDARLVVDADPSAPESALVQSADHVVCGSDADADATRAVTRAPVDVITSSEELPTPTAAGFEHRAHLGMVADWTAGPTPRAATVCAGSRRRPCPRCAPRFRGAACSSRVPNRRRTSRGSTRAWCSSSARSAIRPRSTTKSVSSSPPSATCAGGRVATEEAVRYGVPVVSTAEAASALDADLREAVWVAADATQFADAVVALLTDRTAWERHRQLSLIRHRAPDTTRPGAEAWPSVIRSALASGVRRPSASVSSTSA